MSVVIGVALVLLTGQLGEASSPDITGTVVVIVGLLAAGIVFGLRPWSDA